MLAFELMLVLIALCLLTQGYQVKEDEVTFYLYKRTVENLKLSKDNICEVEAGKDVYFLVHARGVNRNTSFVGESTDIYLENSDCNVIQVDWSPLAAQPDYIPRDGTSDAGYYIAKLIRRLYKRQSIPLDRINLVGHSLGAQVVSFTAKHVKTILNGRLKRVTGLDRANEVFSEDPALNGLHEEDADVVAVVHTDDLGLGNIGSVGTIDFYANGGVAVQPGCVNNSTDPNCSHGIVLNYFVESLENPLGFVATNCDSYENYLSGRCEGNDKVTLGGDLRGRQGDYYFETNAVAPFSKENATGITQPVLL